MLRFHIRAMTISHFLRAIAAPILLALPATGWSRDKHDWHHENHGGWSDHHFSNHSYRRPYYRGYGYSYPSFGYGYGSDYGYPYDYGYPDDYPYGYYRRPTFGFSFFSRPYSSYPSDVYRGRVASGYSDRLAVDVQRELRRRGYYRGSIDGDIGPGSRAAIRSYQADRGRHVTGRIDSSLLRALGID